MTAQLMSNAPSIGQHNQSVMDSLTRAKQVAVMLSRAGCTVNHVIASNRNARIVVRHHPVLTDLLEAAEIMRTPLNTTMAANLDGVQIEWVIGRAP